MLSFTVSKKFENNSELFMVREEVDDEAVIRDTNCQLIGFSGRKPGTDAAKKEEISIEIFGRACKIFDDPLLSLSIDEGSCAIFSFWSSLM